LAFNAETWSSDNSVVNIVRLDEAEKYRPCDGKIGGRTPRELRLFRTDLKVEDGGDLEKRRDAIGVEGRDNAALFILGSK
jgi:hypothetical protein